MVGYESNVLRRFDTATVRVSVVTLVTVFLSGKTILEQAEMCRTRVAFETTHPMDVV